MKFHESGLWDAPVLLLLPGTCCHWKKNFGLVLPMLNELADCFQPIAQEKGIDLSPQGCDATVTGYPVLLRELFHNLIDNARKASEEGCRIFLHGKLTQNGYLLSVTDEGRGMPPEAIARLTEPFYMVDKSRSRAEGGAGLGLALCEKIAVLHGSRLQFSSELGKGTRVSVCLGGASE